MDFVLIHSTGQSAVGWDRLASELEARGARAHAVDLPNDRPELRASDYASFLVERYSHLERPTVVAHSGSGPLLPASATALRACEQVWLAAQVPHRSLSFMEEVRQHKDDAFDPGWIGQDPVNDDGAAIRFVYHDCDQETRLWALTTRRDFFPEAVYNERIPLNPSIHSRYIVAVEDRTIRPDWQRRMARERVGPNYSSVPSYRHFGTARAP